MVGVVIVSSTTAPANLLRSASARRSSAFAVGQSSGSHCVVRMRRISSVTRGQGRRKGRGTPRILPWRVIGRHPVRRGRLGLSSRVSATTAARCTASHGLRAHASPASALSECSKPLRKKHRAPAATVVAPQLEVVLLARHPRHDVADSSPGVEAPMQQLKLRLARLQAEEAESGAEKAGAVVEYRQSVSPDYEYSRSPQASARSAGNAASAVTT